MRTETKCGGAGGLRKIKKSPPPHSGRRFNEYDPDLAIEGLSTALDYKVCFIKNNTRVKK